MRKSAKLCLYSVVIAGVVGGTAAWATTDKTVSVSIDGQTRTIHTRSATVGGALHSAHIMTTEHDAIAPDVKAKVGDHSRIVIRKGRLLHLTVDGKKIDVWTTATTVEDALAAMGYGTDKTVSVSRSTRLPLTATEISLLTPKTITIVADGKARVVGSTAPTVAALLQSAGVKLSATDRVSAKLTSKLVDHEVIKVTRVRVTQKVEKQAIPFQTTSTNDPNTPAGNTVVVTAGKAGSQRVVYQLVYVDGKLTEQRRLSSQVLSPPVTKVLMIGTMQAPVEVTQTAPTTSASTSSTPTPAPAQTQTQAPVATSGPVPSGDAQSIAAQMVSARGWGSDQFGCLVSLWNRESGWNTHAANSSGAYGIPQALPGSKMASAGPDWQDSASTQISWGLGYISARYGNPCGAWAHSQSSGWY